MMLRLTPFWMAIFLFLHKFTKALNLDVVKFSDRLASLEKLSYETKAVSSNQSSTNPHCTSFLVLHLRIILVLHLGVFCIKIVTHVTSLTNV